MHKTVDHPLVAMRVTMLRDRNAPPQTFRLLANEIAHFLAYEALRDLPTRKTKVETPLAVADGVAQNARVVVVPILRAGMGMLDALLKAIPDAAVGVLGMQRNEETAEPEPYYAKVPPPFSPDDIAIVIDPMLATGGSACDAMAHLKGLGYRRIKFLCLISAPEGISRLESEHPDVEIWTASLDSHLNERRYIVPGLGDAGDRIFATIQPAANP